MNLPFPPFLPRPTDLFVRGFNALLRREPWARERLAPHAGKAVRIAIGTRWAAQLSITSDGGVQTCDPAIVPAVTLSIAQDRIRDLPAAWREQGMAGVTGLAHIHGDAGLAHLISDLAHTLRWDVEDDLSRVVGDVAAVRLVDGARALAAGARKAAGRAQDNVAEYLAEESGLVVPGGDFRAWRARLQALETRLDQLEARVRRLPEAAC
ncbi:ubiquinone biosynthesis accessory factor UbiJ [Castellaniella caeni]|uniref:ubiquinone biosynthesis accessory factor UbiJ n=1 Tax=Castellaniella caeni TaxID=266123 RepID=UPI000831D105|nr:SCP2 sterol-binding domain-containing protein [Castellaniella caeni]